MERRDFANRTGTRILAATMRYAGRLHAGDTLTATVTVAAKVDSDHSLRLAVRQSA